MTEVRLETVWRRCYSKLFDICCSGKKWIIRKWLTLVVLVFPELLLSSALWYLEEHGNGEFLLLLCLSSVDHRNKVLYLLWWLYIPWEDDLLLVDLASIFIVILMGHQCKACSRKSVLVCSWGDLHGVIWLVNKNLKMYSTILKDFCTNNIKFCLKKNGSGAISATKIYNWTVIQHFCLSKMQDLEHELGGELLEDYIWLHRMCLWGHWSHHYNLLEFMLMQKGDIKKLFSRFPFCSGSTSVWIHIYNERLYRAVLPLCIEHFLL